MRDHAAEIIRQLVPGAELIHGENVELDGEESRADLVYWVLYKDQEHLIDLELQSGPDSEMQYRMLFYHVELHIQHKRPVISVVLYLFESSLPECPYVETGNCYVHSLAWYEGSRCSIAHSGNKGDGTGIYKATVWKSSFTVQNDFAAINNGICPGQADCGGVHDSA